MYNGQKVTRKEKRMGLRLNVTSVIYKQVRNDPRRIRPISGTSKELAKQRKSNKQIKGHPQFQIYSNYELKTKKKKKNEVSIKL